ncbi:TetR/AcrR family transcriptional regulator [Salinifilum ghardaiensis]
MPRQPLISRAAAVTEAVHLLDEHGSGALSMRSVAQRLGVRSPSLYKHFRDLDDLLDAVAEGIIDGLLADLPHETTSWRRELDQLARAYYRTFQRHPHAISLVMGRPLRSTRSIAGLDALLQILLDDGWSTSNAGRALLLVESYALGAAVTAASAGFAAADGECDEHPALSAVLADSHPHLQLGARDFEHGLAMLLDGIARDLAPAA